ncbi:MAG: hypothetical protein AUJ12_05310 [Alphaproteobacteria bacterium CG1_02_46_17]|nr:MAG: hypothetical protein AUJ12_05310 [Alphaproteobacteria bacterium CG1_02_46_17]
MKKNENNIKFHHSGETCPAFLALGLIANKWSVKILYALSHAGEKPLRFGEIQKLLGNITQRELSKHLREFERSGLVTRKAYPEVPPRVEYKLTRLGYSLKEPVDALSNWSQTYGAEVLKNRGLYEEKKS